MYSQSLLALRGYFARRSSSLANGLSLVEVLVATTIMTVVLAAFLGWLWSAVAAFRFLDDRCQATAAATTALRVVITELETATAIADPGSEYSPTRAIRLRRSAPGVLPETFLIAWDPRRCVLWRKTPSTYIADHVTAFSLVCYGPDGAKVFLSPDSEIDPLEGVSRVSVSLSVSYGSASVSLRRDVPLLVS